MKAILSSLAMIGGLVAIAVADEPESKPVDALDELTSQETQLIEFTNAERKKLDLLPLHADPALMKIARAHSANMARLNTLSHDLESQSFSQRLEKAKYQASRAAENIATGQRTPEVAVTDWMQSPGHKANISHAEYTQIGTARTVSSSGQIYWVQVFAAP